jgi:hypothetical protein
VDSSLAPQPTNRPAVPPQMLPPQPPRFAYTLDGWIKIVSSRVVCLVAVLGAIGVCGSLLYNPDSMRPVHVWLLGTYCSLVVIPSVLLYLKRD